MGSKRKVARIDDLSAELKKILEEYSKDAYKTIELAGKEVSEKGRLALKDSSMRMFNKNLRKKKNSKGELVPEYKYATGWRVAVEIGRMYVSYEIHNKNQPTLTHLLEYGHELWQGGRWDPPQEHIAPVEEKLEKEFVEKIIHDLSEL